MECVPFNIAEHYISPLLSLRCPLPHAITRTNTWKRVYMRARAAKRSLAGDIDSFCRQFCSRRARWLPPAKTRILAWAAFIPRLTRISRARRMDSIAIPR